MDEKNCWLILSVILCVLCEPPEKDRLMFASFNFARFFLPRLITQLSLLQFNIPLVSSSDKFFFPLLLVQWRKLWCSFCIVDSILILLHAHLYSLSSLERKIVLSSLEGPRVHTLFSCLLFLFISMWNWIWVLILLPELVFQHWCSSHDTCLWWSSPGH